MTRPQEPVKARYGQEKAGATGDEMNSAGSKRRGKTKQIALARAQDQGDTTDDDVKAHQKRQSFALLRQQTNRHRSLHSLHNVSEFS